MGARALVIRGEPGIGKTITLPPGRRETLDLGLLGPEALRRVLAGFVDTISRPAHKRVHGTGADPQCDGGGGANVVVNCP